jgi:hypothetical protein
MKDNPYADDPEEYPTDEEIPDEPVTVDDIDPFKVDKDFENINDFSAAEWKKQSTADERIRTVINRTTSPKSVSHISDVALVSEPKARDILNKLDEEGIVRIYQTESKRLYSQI